MKAQQEEIKIKGKKESNIDGLLNIKTSLDETIKKKSRWTGEKDGEYS